MLYKENNFILYKMNDLSENIINEEVEIIEDISGIKFRINSINESPGGILKNKIKAARTIQSFFRKLPRKIFNDNIKIKGKK